MNIEWQNIKLIASDFDGVMTDNRVLMDENGKESVYVSRADGQAVHMLKAMGVDLIIISTEVNGVVRKRAEKLHVKCIQSVVNKKECLEQYCREKNIVLSDVAYVGNDINDLEVMQIAGIKIVPQDAYKEVKDIADFVTDVQGGHGVIREIAGMIEGYRCRGGKILKL